MIDPAAQPVYLNLYRDFSLQRVNPYHTDNLNAPPAVYGALLTRASELASALSGARLTLPSRRYQDASLREIRQLNDLIAKAHESLKEFDAAQRRGSEEAAAPPSEAPASRRRIQSFLRLVTANEPGRTDSFPVPDAAQPHASSRASVAARLAFGSGRPLQGCSKAWELAYWRVGDFIERRQNLAKFALGRAERFGWDPLDANFHPAARLLFLDYEIPLIAGIYGGGAIGIGALIYALSP